MIADLVDVTRLHTVDAAHRVPHLAFQPRPDERQPILPMSEVVTSYYLRLRVVDQAGVLAKVASLLAIAGISIDAMLQREASAIGGKGSTQTDLILLTHSVREGTMNEVIAQMQGLATVLAPITRIRKEELVERRNHAAPLHPRHLDRKHFCEILLEGLAPDGGLYLPERYPKSTRPRSRSGAGCPTRTSRFEILSLYIDDIPAGPVALCRKTYTPRCSARADRAAEDARRGRALRPVERPDAGLQGHGMQLLGNLFEYELARRGEELNILGATSGDTGSAAEYAMRGKKGVRVFMTSPRAA